MEDLNKQLSTAQQMLGSNTLDKTKYAELENYILKNGSLLAHNSDFDKLRDLVENIAQKYDIRSPRSIQESFGLNSCAQ